MSFVSFKRQLSANLDSFSSRKKAYKSTRKSNQTTSVRLLGDLSWNARKNVVVPRLYDCVSSPSKSCRRRLFESCPRSNTSLGISSRPRSIISATFPRTRPSSRQAFPPLHFPTCHWTDGNEQLHESSTSDIDSALNTSRNTPDLSTVLIPGRQHAPDLQFPVVDLTLKHLHRGAFSCISKGISGREYGPDFQMFDRRRPATVKLVVTLPKTDDADSPVVLSYKHGKIRMAF